MQTLELDGSNWESQRDFYESLAEVLGSIEWHGRNADAFLETMVYYLDLNTVQPPYEVAIKNAPAGLRSFLGDFARWVKEARADRFADPNWGDDVEVTVTIA